MPKNLTDNQKAEISKPELKTRVLITIDLDDGPLRIIENESITSLTIDGNQYFAGMVKRDDIVTATDGTLEKTTVSISNIWQEISSLISNDGDTLTNRTCLIESVIFDGDSNTIIDEPIPLFEGVINNIQLTAYELTFDVERKIGGYSIICPNSTYDVNCQCKKFKDERCKYIGSATYCDKTLNCCKNLDNILNFYGFPSITKVSTGT